MPLPDSLKRLAWFFGLYAASLAAFTALVYGLRALVAV
jgi:hypothetical protein